MNALFNILFLCGLVINGINFIRAWGDPRYAYVHAPRSLWHRVWFWGMLVLLQLVIIAFFLGWVPPLGVAPFIVYILNHIGIYTLWRNRQIDRPACKGT